MPIPRRLLDDDEEVLVDLRPHWLFLFAPVATTVLVMAGAAAIAAQFHPVPSAVTWLLVVAVAVPTAWLAVRLARWFSWSLVVTSRRLVLRRGVLRRDVVQLRLARIAEVHCRQEFWQRLVLAGRLVIEVVGEERPLVIHDVRRPRELQRVIARQLDRLAGGEDWPDLDRTARVGPPRPATVPWSGEPTPPGGMSSGAPRRGGTPSVTDQLLELDQLRRRGIVSEDEFALKKAQLLERM